MKKAFTLALSIVISSSMFAAADFYLKLNSNGNYTVSLNNQTQTSASNIFRFNNLAPGNYLLKVQQDGLYGRILYNQPVSLADGYRTAAEMNPNFVLSIIDKMPLIQNAWYQDGLTGYPNHPPYGNGQNQPYPPKPHYPKPKDPKGCNHSCPYHNGCNGNGYGQYYPNYPYPYSGNNGNYYNMNLMDEAGMQSLMQTMKNVSFDDKMYNIAKTALKNRSVKTSQVHQLLQLFSFEKYKLDLAKHLYDKTIDKEDYYTLYNDFDFDSYSSQLDKYINSK